MFKKLLEKAGIELVNEDDITQSTDETPKPVVRKSLGNIATHVPFNVAPALIPNTDYNQNASFSSGAFGSNMVQNPDPEIVATLTKAMAESTVEGYSEFVTMFEALKNIPTSLNAISAGTKGKITPAVVVKSIDDRIDLLQKEKASFIEYLASETKTQITDKQDAATKIAQQIADLENQQRQISGEIANSSADLERQRASFDASFNAVLSGVSAERNAIAAFLPTPTVK
jgi:hypothetical protein